MNDNTSPLKAELPGLPKPHVEAAKFTCAACDAPLDPTRWGLGCKCGNQTFSGTMNYKTPNPDYYTAAQMLAFRDEGIRIALAARSEANHSATNERLIRQLEISLPATMTDEALVQLHKAAAAEIRLLSQPRTCPHAGPFAYCSECSVSPCPIGLGAALSASRPAAAVPATTFDPIRAALLVMLHEARNFNERVMREAGVGPFDLVAIRQAESALATPPAASGAEGERLEAFRYRWLADDCDGNAQDDFIRYLRGHVMTRQGFDAAIDRAIAANGASTQGGAHG